MKNKVAQKLILVFGLGLGFNAYAGFVKIIDDLFDGLGKAVKHASNNTNSPVHHSTTPRQTRVDNIKKALKDDRAMPAVPNVTVEEIAHGVASGKQFAEKFVFKNWDFFVENMNNEEFLNNALPTWLELSGDPMTFNRINSYLDGLGRSDLSPETITQAAYLRVLLDVANRLDRLDNSDVDNKGLTEGFDTFKSKLATAMDVDAGDAANSVKQNNSDGFLNALKKLVDDTDASCTP